VRRSLGKNGAGLEGAVLIMLYNLIGRQCRQASERFARLAARLEAGWVYVPKPPTPRKPAAETAERPPRTTNPLLTGSGWLLRAAPGPDCGAANDALYRLLEDPEIKAILAAAPEPAWRILRPLCSALGVRKPAILGPSKPPKPGKPISYPPPPLPWEVVPYIPDATELYRKPSFFWPWIGPKPKIA